MLECRASVVGFVVSMTGSNWGKWVSVVCRCSQKPAIEANELEVTVSM